MSYAKSDYLEGEILKHIFRTGSFTKPTVLGVGLLKTLPSDDAGTGLAELAMTSYARVQRNPLDANWSAVSGGTTDNVGDLDFGTLTGTGERAIGMGIWDATSGGNLLYWSALATGWRHAVIDATADELVMPGHGFTNNQRVFLRGIVSSTGISQQTEYYVIGADANSIQLSLTQGGAAVTITTDGYCSIGLSKAKDIGDGDAVKFVAGALDVNED